ncbi:Membrane metallo-endopeptidase-like 1 [Mactra antiquata]
MMQDNPDTSTSGWRFSDVQQPSIQVQGFDGNGGDAGKVKVVTKTSNLVSTALFILVVACIGLTVALVVVLLKNKDDPELVESTTVFPADRCNQSMLQLSEKQTQDLVPTGTPAVKGTTARTDTTASNDTCQSCLTEGCTRAAARVLNSLDRSANPCENFYQYACGGFLKSHVIPEDRGNIDNWAIVRDNVQYICKFLLEDPNTDPNATAVQKAKDLYNSCIDEDLIDKKGTSVAVPLLDELGGWPVLGNQPGGHWNESDFDLAKLVATLRKYNNKVIIDMGVTIDEKNSMQRIISFNQQDTGIGSKEYYLDPYYQEMKEAYTVLARDIAVLFGADEQTADKDMRDAVEFETALANITLSSDKMRDINTTYNKMTLGDMKTRFGEPKLNEPIQFSWLDFTQDIFGQDGVNITIEADEPVLVSSLLYYENILDLLQQYPKRTIANYMIWRIMQNRARNLPRSFRERLGEYDKVLYGVNTRPANWKRCMGYTILQLGQAVGSLYVQEAFDETAKETALDMIHGIKEAFIDILQEEVWMDNATRVAAREKAEAMYEWIGYADDILNTSIINDLYSDVAVDRNEYFQNVLGNLKRWGIGDISSLRYEYSKNGWSDPPTTVNAMYSFILNNIQFPAGIFQPPFYEKSQPRSMNYGGIGVVIGHEITHGFDDQGSLFDKDGNYKQWWDTSIIEKFYQRAQCMVNQYGNFVVPEANLNVNGQGTLGENIADNGGLKQSFRAYRKWVESQGQEEPQLPGVDLTHDQLFFLSFAQVWCDKEKPQSVISSINSDPHSPAQFRVIGTLQNSEDFAKTFQCPVGSVMNPAKKCSVW